MTKGCWADKGATCKPGHHDNGKYLPMVLGPTVQGSTRYHIPSPKASVHRGRLRLGGENLAEVTPGIVDKHSSHLGYLATKCTRLQPCWISGPRSMAPPLVVCKPNTCVQWHMEGPGTVETQARFLGNASEFLEGVAAKAC